MFVRWLGAFRKGTNSSVYSSVKFELSRQTEFACEKIRKGRKVISLPGSDWQFVLAMCIGTLSPMCGQCIKTES